MALPSGLLFYPAKQAFSLCGDTDTDNLFPANAGMGKQFANDSHAALPQFCHIALCPAAAGLMRTAAGAARLPPGLRGHTARLSASYRHNLTPASIASWFIAPHPRLSVDQHPAEHLYKHVADLSTQCVAKGFAVEIGDDFHARFFHAVDDFLLIFGNQFALVVTRFLRR